MDLHEKFCPIGLASAQLFTCNTDCAWCINIQENSYMCAIAKISISMDSAASDDFIPVMGMDFIPNDDFCFDDTEMQKEHSESFLHQVNDMENDV